MTGKRKRAKGQPYSGRRKNGHGSMGVQRRSDCDKWGAWLCRDGIITYLGSYDTEAEAAAVREQALQRYNGLREQRIKALLPSTAKPIPHFTGYYADTNCEIWSTNRNKPLRLKQRVDRRGYYVVGITNDAGREVIINTHHLTLLAHREVSLDKPVGRHMDGNPQNNVLSNLEWGTYQDNSLDRRRHGTAYVGGATKLKPSQAKEILELKGQITARELSSRFGIQAQTIRLIWRREAWVYLEEALRLETEGRLYV